MSNWLTVAVVWVGAIVLVAVTGFSPVWAAVVVAFVTIGALLGFRVGGSDGPTDSSTGSSGGPGPSV